MGRGWGGVGRCEEGWLEVVMCGHCLTLVEGWVGVVKSWGSVCCTCCVGELGFVVL